MVPTKTTTKKKKEKQKNLGRKNYFTISRLQSKEFYKIGWRRLREKKEKKTYEMRVTKNLGVG